MRGKILIIENQIRQFEDIFRTLTSSGYKVGPAIGEFKCFIDAIRVFLNPRYGCDRRDAALKEVLAAVKDLSPDILIIDHILVGNDSSQNGIDLAVRLRKEKFFMPIAFFSRTIANDFSIIENLPRVEEIKVWLPKAYWGGINLDDTLFKNLVVPELDKLIQRSGLLMMENFINKEMSPFLENIKKERQVMHKGSGKPEIKKALDSLELLINNIKQFQENKGLIIDPMKEGFAKLEELTGDGLFEEEEWVNACNELAKLFEYD
jgi:hypothetical protein